MDWDRYKRDCDSPEVFSRWMLMQTLELLQLHLVQVHKVQLQRGFESEDLEDVRSALSAVLAGQPIPRPVDHTGGVQTDMFRLNLEASQACRLLEIVRGSVASNTTTSATRERGLGGFVEAWSEYSDSLTDRWRLQKHR